MSIRVQIYVLEKIDDRKASSPKAVFLWYLLVGKERKQKRHSQNMIANSSITNTDNYDFHVSVV
jgi:hypothetical protein